MKRLLLILLPIFVMVMGLNVAPGHSQVPLPTSAPASLISADSYIRSDRLGITFISSGNNPADAERYRNALMLGAGWNRWPLYWRQVEVNPGEFDWSAYDRVVTEDLRNGLKINAILLSMPEFYRDGDRVQGLHEPVFADGTDRPGADKSFNPDNLWAMFVFQAVQRYKPGGTLALEQNWPAGMGVSVWEAWNEPDFEPFWSASIADYARLLKVAYLAAHTADPEAQVMFGGLVYGTEDNWLARVLAIYQNDPFRAENNWYMDIVAIHNYSYPWRSGWLVRWVDSTLHAYGLTRPIWVNESGVPVWNDYPGPVWASTPAERQLRATTEQQAWFFIQSTTYAFAEGAEVVFFHQLYDDCGNQPPGTDFPPHNGELCSGSNLCVGDAHGLYRNEQSSDCFKQHPFPGTPRLAARAFRLIAEVFGNGGLENPQVESPDGAATVISFERTGTDERVYVVWNRTFNEVTLDLPAGDGGARLYSLDGGGEIFPNGDGVYHVALSPATPDDFPFLEAGDYVAIGGPPLIIVEGVTQPFDIEGVQVAVSSSVDMSYAPLTVTPGPIFTPPPRPTVDPATDNVPPVTSMVPLPETSPATFTVLWHGQDDSGIDRYLVWVRVDGGEWQPWLETARTEADYTGASGSLYEFAAWAIDLAGNWSSNTELAVQAATRVE